MADGSDLDREERERQKSKDPLYQHGNKFLAELAELGPMDQDGMEYALSVMKEAREKIMKKFEELKCGASKSGATSSSSSKEKDKKDSKDKSGKKGKKTENDDTGSGTKEVGTVTGATTSNVVSVAAPPGLFYVPVRPHPMVFSPFPVPIAPPVAPVIPVPVQTDKVKRRKRRMD